MADLLESSQEEEWWIKQIQDVKSWRVNAGPKWEVHEVAFYGAAASRGLDWDLIMQLDLK